MNCSRFVFFVLSLVLFTGIALEVRSEDEDKSGRYLKVLLRKPGSGYLFDKFYQSWAENHAPGKLQPYLMKKLDSSKNPVYLLLLAYLHEKEGEDERALVCYEQYLEKRPEDVSARYDQARLEFYAGNFPEVITILEAALKLKPEPDLELKIRKMLGRSLVREGKQEKGLEVWLKYVESQKGDGLLTDEVIDLMIAEGLFGQAEKLCKKQLKLTTNKFRQFLLTMKLGDIYRRQDKIDAASKAYADALSRVAGDSWQEKEIFSRIEQLYQSQNDSDGLLKMLKKLAMEHPGRIELRKRLIKRLWSAGKQKEALKLLGELLKKAPLDRGLKFQYAELLSKSGRYEDALKVLRQLRKNEPKAADIPLKIAILEDEFKHPDKAFASLKEYLELSGKTENVYLDVGKRLAVWGMKKEAGNIYSEAVKAFPDSFRVAENRAAFLYGIGKKQDALKEFKKLSARANVDQLLQICRILQMVNQRKAALEAMESRAKDFSGDFRFQEELFYLALSGKKYSEAFVAAKRMTALASTFQELSRAVSDVMYIAMKQKQLTELISQLQLKSSKARVNNICLLSWLLEENDDPEQAMKVIDNGLKKLPDNEILLRWKLRLLTSRKNWKTAIAVLENMAKSRKRKSTFLRELVLTCIKAGKYEKALHWVAEWRKLNPAATEPVFMEAGVYREQQNYPKVVDVLLKASYRFPDNREISENLVRAYLTQNKRAEAMKIYWKLLGNAKTLSAKLDCIRKMSYIASYGEEKDKFIRRLKTLAEKNPKSIFPLLALAAITRMHQEYEKCRSYLMQAFEIKGNDLSLLCEIAELAEEQGDYEQAESILKRMVKLDKAGVYRQNLIKFYFRNGEDERGFKILFNDLNRKQLSPYEVKDVAKSLLSSHRAEEAVKFLTPQVEKFPDNYQIRYLYANALEKAGKTEKAIDQYLELLRQRRELPGAKKPLSMSVRNPTFSHYARVYGKSIPKEAIDLLEMRNFYHQMRNYRSSMLNRRLHMQQRMLYYPGGYGGLSGLGGYPVPHSVKSLRKYCLCRLSDIGTKLSPEKQEKLVTELTDRGIKYADVIIRIGFNYNVSKRQVWEELMKKYPNDPGIISLRMILNFSSRPKFDEIVKIYKSLKDKNPELALLVLQRGIYQAPGGIDKILKEGLALLKTLKDPPDNLLLGFASVIRNNKFDKKIKKEFLDFYLDIYTSANLKPQAKNSMFYFLIQPVIQQKNWKMFHKIIADQFSSKNPSGRFPYYYTGPGHQSICGYPLIYNRGKTFPVVLMFPPQMLNNFPPMVLSMFSRHNNSYIPNNIDKEELWKHLKDIKHPIFQLVLADYCGKKEGGKLWAENILKSDKSAPLDMVMAAAWLGKHEQPLKAAELLDKLAKSDKVKKDRKQIYGAILNFAITAKDKKSSQKLIGEYIAKLKKIRMSRTEKAQLAAFLFESGLSEQAQAFIPKNINTTTISRNSLRGRVSPTVRYLDTFQKINQMLQSGNMDNALKLAERELRKFVSQQAASILSSQYYHNQNQYKIRNMFQQLQRSGADKKFLEMLKKKASSNRRSKTVYAYSCEKLGKLKLAEKEYREILKKTPKYQYANYKLALLLSGSKPKEAMKYFKNYLGNDFNRASMHLVNNFHQQGNNELRLKYVEMFTVLLESMVENKKNLENLQNPHIVNTFFNYLRQPQYFGGQNLPQLFSKSAKKFPAGSAAEKFAKKRNDLFLRLCAACEKFPQLAKTGFQQKYKFLEFENKINKTTYEEAKKIVKLIGETNQFGVSTQYFNGRPETPVDPEEFLLNYAYSHNLQSDLDKFVESLPKSNNFRKIYNEIKSLYTCKTNDFIPLAKKLIDNQSIYGSYNYSKLESSFRQIFTAWNTRKDKDKINLSPLVLSAIEKLAITNRQYYYAANFPAAWGDELSKSKNAKWLKSYITDLSKLLFCKFIKDYVKTMPPNNQTFPHGLAQSYCTLALLLAERDPETFFVVLYMLAKAVKKHPKLFSNVHTFNNVFSNLNNKVKKWEFISKSPYLKSFADYRVYNLPQAHTSIMAYTITNIRNNSKTKKEFLEKIKKISPKTFGTGFMTVILEGKHKDQVYEYLAAKLPEIQKAPLEIQKEFCVDIEKIMKSSFRGKYDKAVAVKAKPYYDFSRKMLQLQAKDELKNIEKQDIRNYWQYFRKIAPILVKLSETDPKKADELYNKIEKKLKVFQLSNPGYYGSNSPMAQLLQQLYEYSKSPASIAFCYKIASGTKPLPNWYTVNRFYSKLSECIRQTMDRRRNELQSGNMNNSKAQAAAFIEAAVAMDKAFGKNCPPLLFSIFYNRINQIDSQGRKGIAESLAVKAKSSTSGDFLEQAAVSAEYVAEGNKVSSAIIDKIVKMSLSQLKDQKTPMLWKGVAFNHNISFYSGNPLFIPVIAAGVEIYTKIPRVPGQHRNLNLDNILKALNYSKSSSPQWKKSAESIIKAWMVEYNLNRRNYIKNDRTRRKFIAAVSILESLGRSKEAESLINSQGPKIWIYPDMYVMLLNQGKAKECVKMFKENYMRMNQKNINGTPLTPKGVKLIPEVVKSFDDPDVRIYANIFFRSMSEVMKNPDGSIKFNHFRNQKNLQELVKKLPETKFKNTKIRKKCIELLLQNGRYVNYLKDLLPEVFESMSPRRLMYANHYIRNHYPQYLRYLLDAGKYKQFSEKITAFKKALKNTTNRNNHNLIYPLQRSCDEYFNYLRSHKGIKAKPELLAKIGSELTSGNARLQQNANLICSILMLYFISGKEQEAEKYLKTIAANRLNHLRSYNLREALRVMDNLKGRSEKTSRISLKFLNSILTAKAFKGRENEVAQARTQLLSSTPTGMKHNKDDLKTLITVFKKKKEPSWYDINQLEKTLKVEFQPVRETKAPAKKLINVYKKLYELSGHKFFVSVGDPLHRSIGRLSAEQIENIIKSLGKIRKNTDNLLLKEIILYCKLRLIFKTKKVPSEKDNQMVIAFFEKLFSDKMVSQTVKIDCIMDFYKNFLEFPIIPKLIPETVKIYVSSDYTKKNTNGIEFVNLIRLCCNNLKNPARKENMKILGQFWLKYGKKINTNMFTYYSYYLVNILCASASDEEIIKYFSPKSNNKLCLQLPAYLGLINGGKYKLAAELFKKNYRIIEFNWRGGFFCFTPELWEKINKTISLLKSEDMKLLMEYAFASLSRTSSYRNGRICYTGGGTQECSKKLLNSFQNTKFNDSEFRKKCLFILLKNRSFWEKLENEYTKILDKLPLEELANFKRPFTHLYANYLFDLFKNNKMALYREKMQQLNEYIENKKTKYKYIKYFYSAIAREYTMYLINKKETYRNPEELIEALKLILKNLRPDSYYKKILFQVIALMFLTGKDNEALKLVKSCNPELVIKSPINYLGYSYMVFNFSMIGKSKDEITAERIKFLNSPAIKYIFKNKLKELEKHKKGIDPNYSKLKIPKKVK